MFDKKFMTAGRTNSFASGYSLDGLDSLASILLMLDACLVGWMTVIVSRAARTSRCAAYRGRAGVTVNVATLIQSPLLGKMLLQRRTVQRNFLAVIR
jgi:hypothetical protein